MACTWLRFQCVVGPSCMRPESNRNDLVACVRKHGWGHIAKHVHVRSEFACSVSNCAKRSLVGKPGVCRSENDLINSHNSLLRKLLLHRKIVLKCSGCGLCPPVVASSTEQDVPETILRSCAVSSGQKVSPAGEFRGRAANSPQPPDRTAESPVSGACAVPPKTGTDTCQKHILVDETDSNSSVTTVIGEVQKMQTRGDDCWSVAICESIGDQFLWHLNSDVVRDVVCIRGATVTEKQLSVALQVCHC